VISYLVQVDNIELLPCNAVEQASLLVQEYDFHRLKLFGKFTGGNIRINVENLAIQRLG
jgi:hypothetical protein